jgi:hypothetical protein
LYKKKHSKIRKSYQYKGYGGEESKAGILPTIAILMNVEGEMVEIEETKPEASPDT